MISSNKKKIYTNIFGYIFIIIIYIPLIIIILLTLFEYLGFAKKILKKNYNITELVRGIEDTDYYNQKNYGDPYDFINTLSFHPHYFSIASQGNEKNIDIVKVNNNGFRLNFKNNFNKNKAVFLGGSVAFGHGATSNFNTIPSYLSKYSKNNFINLGQPIWNSSQELLSLLRYDEKFEMSISFSLSNDIHSFCVNKKNSHVIDSPELFSFINNVYESSYKNFFNKLYLDRIYDSFKNTIKIIGFKIYPKSYNLLQANKRKHQGNVYIPFQQTNTALNCIKHFKELKKSIVENQLRMHQIAKSRNAKHIFIIQPFLHLHENYNFLSNKEFLLNEKKLINSILDSELCNTIKCIDLTNYFDQLNFKQLVYDPGLKFCYNICFSDKVKELYNQDILGLSFEKNVFIDNYHLTDKGNLLIAKKIIEEIY